ncbi:TetR/AcrR family transcriptional regulator [Wenxinia marina]|uniref:Transcriptional regulator, TetR family n=1 Tax=Wenxinia marina DSM 24838 TaxID=1123501 RepID=A0A0D0QCF9_9RHOB|nr:TetR/AcrR family transcriptional regulator [Wenxinia marina]KIQ70012.1 transcriptional regulator, TetR family [Wenxinia marina DSM 24838]GGL62827.1 TetR family transcriptional regulator [Wenxinia marina]
MPDGSSGEVRRGRKFDQVLAGAREVFLSDGFEGASVDDIARAANVSKATLYSYFPDKRLLFSEVAQAECQRQTEVALAEIDRARPVRDVLTDIATRVIAFLTSQFGQRIFRMCVAESERFPSLGRAFYETGPARVRRLLVDYFREAAGRGELRIDDFDLAADQFHELCKADIFVKLVFNLQRDFSPAQKARVIDGAVETFLARYGA